MRKIPKHKLLNISLTIISVLLVHFVFAKGINTGSDQLHQNSSIDTQKIKILEQARLNRTSNRELSIEYYKQVLEFENSDFEKAVILDTIGLFNWQLGNYQEALKNLNQSLFLFTDLNDSIWLGKVYNNIAVANWGLGQSNEALKFYHRALSIRSALNDKRGVSNILNNIGKIYQDWGIYDEANQYHNKALNLAFEINDTNAIAYSYSNIGNCYEHENQLNTAHEYYVLGYNILLKKDKNNRSNSFFSANIGGVYSKMNKLDSALYYFKQSYAYAHRINNLNRISIAEYNLGKTYFRLNKLDSANYFIQLSYNNSVKKNYSGLIKDNLYLLSQLEDKKGNTTKAFEFYTAASLLKDSLFNKEKIIQLNDLQIKYNLEQQQNENLLLRKNNEIQEVIIQKQKLISSILIIGGIIILIVLGFFIKSTLSLKKVSIKLEKSEKELMAANANKDKFFTIIAHDLKSPFNGLLGISEVLVNKYNELPSNQIKDLLSSLKDSSVKIYALLEGLLQWAQLQTGKMNFAFENINLYHKVLTVAELFESNAENKKITIINRINKNERVFADNNSLETVFRNLISNAIKFTNPGGTVTVEAENTGNEIIVSVTDSGIGMTKETLDKLFRIELNYTTKGTNKETGTGLGLILCKELIEKNRGKLIVESEYKKGSKFIFTLPVQK